MIKKVKKFIKSEFPEEENVIYIVFAIWLSFLIFSFILSSSFETDIGWATKINPGTWGDSFGVINSLVSVITFFLVYKTFGLQKEMLKSQKEELLMARKEMEEQSSVFKKDNFENTFFKLLEQKDVIRGYFQWGERKGIDAIEYLVNPGNNYILEGDSRGFFKVKHTPDINGNFQVYFNTLEIILELLEDSIETEEAKQLYIRLLKSRQSRSENVLIHIYYSSEGKDSKMITTLKKYGIIES